MRKSKVAQLASVFGGVAVAVSSVVASTAMAESYGPKVYGRLDVAIENADVDNGTTSDDTWSIESKSSRLGVKGEEELMHGLSAIYQYEIQIQPEEQDVGSTQTSDFLKARNQFVGLKGDFGKLRIGRMDTPLKKAQGKVDVFADHIGELDGVFNKEGDNRLGDTINYTTPTFADAVTAQLALIQGEGDDFDGDGNPEDGLGDGVSANVIYEQGNLFFAAAVDQDVKGDVKGKDAWRIAGQVKLDAIKLGALYQVAEDNTVNPNERSGFILSAAYDLNGTVFLAQYGDTEQENASGTTIDERSEFSLGIHKNYSKSTTLYAEVSDYSQGLSGSEVDTFTFSTGIRKKF